MFRSIDNTLSTFEIHVSVTSCRNVYFSLKLESFETVANQRAGISSRRQWCSCESANRLWKELDGMFRLTELFASNLNASMLVISPLNTRSTLPSSKNNSINMNWLSWPFCPPLERLNQNFHLKPDIHLTLSAAISKMSLQLDDLLCQIHYVQFSVETLHLKSSQQHLMKFKPRHSRKLQKIASFAVSFAIFSNLH